MRFVVLGVMMAGTAWAACPPAPVGKPADGVVQFVTSGTAGFGPTTALDATREGAVVYDPAAKVLKVCDGTTWVGLGGGGGGGASIPTGTIWAFDLTACPSGWAEYTAARGRFLRGIDNGAGNDPDGTRAPGNLQNDAMQRITGSWHIQSANGGMVLTTGGAFSHATGANGGNLGGSGQTARKVVSFDSAGSPGARTADETRPKNVAVLFCRKT